MPRIKTVAALTYVSLAVVDTTLSGKGTTFSKRLRRLTKPALMPTLATAYATSTSGRRDRLRQGTLAALAFSWAGDVALLGASRRSFLFGVGSFAAAHSCYVAALGSVRHQPTELSTPAVRATAAIWALATPAMAIAAKHKDPGLAVPVAAYVSLISLMFAASTTLDPALPLDVRQRIGIGAALFLVSDTVLGTEKFLVKSPPPWLQRVVMATYTAGQGLIALGVASSDT